LNKVKSTLSVPGVSLGPIEPRLHFFRRLVRRFRPMPKSANPQSEDEVLATNLVPIDRLTAKFVEVLRDLMRDGPLRGDYLEFGVYNGASMSCMYQALRATRATGCRLIGFDSFQGLPSSVVHEDWGVWHAGQFSCPQRLTEKRLRKSGVPLDAVRFVPGWYDDTLNEATRSSLGLREASVVMIDCDAYSSAARALAFIAPLIVSRTFIFFDDWRLNDLDLLGGGEYRAFHEFRDGHRDIRWANFGAYNRKSKVLMAARDRGR
jgi:O-methyltransferase